MTLDQALRRNIQAWQKLNPMLRKVLIIGVVNQISIWLDRLRIDFTTPSASISKLGIGSLSFSNGTFVVNTLDGLQTMDPTAPMPFTLTAATPSTGSSTHCGWGTLVPNSEFATSTATLISNESVMQNQIDSLNREVERLRRAVENFETVTGQRIR